MPRVSFPVEYLVGEFKAQACVACGNTPSTLLVRAAGALEQQQAGAGPTGSYYCGLHASEAEAAYHDLVDKAGEQG